MLPIKKIYIDTRFKSSDSASQSDFNIDLPTTFLVPEDTGFYIVDVCIPHSFYTIEAGVSEQLQYVYNTTTLTVATPEGDYLAAAIADGMNAAIGLSLVVSEVNLRTNTLKISLASACAAGKLNILTDSEVTSSSTKPRSINSMLKNTTSNGMNNSPLVSGLVDSNPIRNLFLSCSGLGNLN